MDKFLRRYLETILSIESMDDELLGKSFTVNDFADEAIEEAKKDCQAFQTEFENEIVDMSKKEYLACAYDLWLTRQRCGAGFWDGDWPEPFASVATKFSHKLGEKYIYLGDDYKLYFGN